MVIKTSSANVEIFNGNKKNIMQLESGVHLQLRGSQHDLFFFFNVHSIFIETNIFVIYFGSEKIEASEQCERSDRILVQTKSLSCN